MRSQLENHLSHQQAPEVPGDLKARCLATIPAPASSSATTPPTRRVVRPKIAATAALMLIALAVAFWNTRPGDNQTTAPSESVAFAQTLKELGKMSFGHVKGRDMEAGILRHGWHASDFFETEMWFDAGRGLYQERRSSPSNSQPALAGGTSERALFLPDGISYYRYAGSNRLLVTSSPGHWDDYKKTFTSLLAGGWGNRPQSSSPAQWKKRKAQLFRAEAESSPQDKKVMPGVARMRTLLYVNPDTKLPIAFQDFAIYGDGIPRLLTEYEFDFSRPDASRFDPAPLKKGAIVSHGREG